MRALGHFSLLRLYGQFFDTSSEYGIVTFNTPVQDITARPRSTVSESYAQIEQDLKFAIANAPQYTTGKYASKQAANMLLAKVYLYKKDYAQAAQYAAATIDQKGNAKLEDKFADVFIKTSNQRKLYWHLLSMMQVNVTIRPLLSDPMCCQKCLILI